MNTPWIQQLPECWQTKRLKTIVELKSVRENGSATSENYIGLENIESWTGRLIPTAIKQVPSEEEESENKGMISHFNSGDILFGKLRPYLAKAHLAKEAGVCTTELLVLKPHENIDGKFLLNVILTHEFINVVNAETFGVKMPRADWGTIGNVLISLPSLSQQRQIADYLDCETQKLDALIAAKKRLLELLAEKRRALITQAVTRGLNPDVPLRDSGIEWLGEIPTHWKVDLARWLFKEIDERSVMGEEDLLTVSHLTGVTLRSEKDVNMFMAETMEGYKICREGDLVINTLWAWMGAMGVAFQDGIVSPAYNVYRPSVQYLPKYIDFLVRISIFAQEVTRYSKGVWSSRLRLYPEGFFEVGLPIPPLDEQEQIIRYLSEQTVKIDNLVDVATTTIALLQERRTSLISAAVTGQLQIPD